MDKKIEEYFLKKGILTPRETLYHFGDLSLSDYVAAIDACGLASLGMDVSTMTHKEIVETHLQKIGPITQREAAFLYNIWRLASVIDLLKKAFKKVGGYKILSKLLPTYRGGKFAKYCLDQISD
jgi:hypothetical protein